MVVIDFLMEHIITVVSISLGLLGAYGVFWTIFRNQKPRLEIKILSDTNVLDVNENISQMDILLDGNSLIQSNKNVKIYTLKIINTGRRGIETGMFDEDTPICICVDNGVLVEPPQTLKNSSDYLKDKFNKVKLSDDNSEISFPKFILNKGEFVDMKLLILHSNDSTPNINVKGKIAGQEKIAINTIANKASFGGLTIVDRIMLLVFFATTIVFALVTISHYHIANETDKMIEENNILLRDLKETSENTTEELKIQIKKAEKNYDDYTKLIKSDSLEKND